MLWELLEIIRSAESWDWTDSSSIKDEIIKRCLQQINAEWRFHKFTCSVDKLSIVGLIYCEINAKVELCQESSVSKERNMDIIGKLVQGKEVISLP